MIIYLESTLNILVYSGQKELVDDLIKQGEVKQTEEGIKYLKL